MMQSFLTKHTAILSMSGVSVPRTVGRYLEYVQCFWRTVRAKKKYAELRRMWEVADMLQK